MGGDGGVVTFLITDQVGSTRTLARLGEDGAEALRQAHFALLRAAAEGAGGEEVKTLGDGLMYAFGSPTAAVGTAVRMQEAVAAHNAGEPAEPLGVRIGLYAGEPVCEDGDYFGTPVVVASRLCAAAKGGQILAGELVATLAGTRGGFRFTAVGLLELKGLAQAVPSVEVEWGEPTATTARPATRPRRRRRAPTRGPNLVGRAEELALLREEFAASAGGELHCVLIAGEAGVGKTRLAAELLQGADAATVLQARAHTMGSTDAFGLWAEAIDPHLQHLGDEEVADLCGGFLDDLAPLLHRVGEARAYDALGRASSATGDRAGAVAAWEQAAQLFEACDAVWRRAGTLEALRRAGSTGRRALAAALGASLGADSLTQRERDVARLAATGASAKEIAAALFVGERTVETHLGNVYAKLGVESKLDLVRRAAELGLG